PNFRNVKKQETDFLRGYMIFYSATRWVGDPVHGQVLGGEFKDSMSEPGGWNVFMMMQGETIPKEENHVRLSADKKDQWGMPLLVTSVGYDDNDYKILKDFHTQGAEMLEKGGVRNISTSTSRQSPGLDIHEMGGVR